jgi:hypothetical protein
MEQCPALDVDALLDDIIGTQETAGSATLDFFFFFWQCC